MFHEPRCQGNTAHETKIPRWTTFTPPQSAAPAAFCGLFLLRRSYPFHIHQVHFLVYQENGKKVAQPEWLDTANVAPEGSVDLIMDFTDPLIRGMSVFHCHLLKHEDKGMMAKILFQ